MGDHSAKTPSGPVRELNGSVVCLHHFLPCQDMPLVPGPDRCAIKSGQLRVARPVALSDYQ